MLQNGNDEHVLKSFRDLRASEEMRAPAFDRVWRTARAAADPQRTTRGRLMVALAMVAVAAVASALTIVATSPGETFAPTIAADPPVLQNPAPAVAPNSNVAEATTTSVPAVAAEAARPTTVSDTPSRKSSKPGRQPRRQKTNQAVPCVEC